MDTRENRRRGIRDSKYRQIFLNACYKGEQRNGVVARERLGSKKALFQIGEINLYKLRL